ncbi:sensor histidine kinase [Konateibacter massiliensis]|uniref:sensor histidine kinase n=1 Tax=Konateibacter massiliensis TaxID=2002841 RepID=UPI0015D48C77|nr:sensor histidine kinase [Konateibacter massiliensis]
MRKKLLGTIKAKLTFTAVIFALALSVLISSIIYVNYQKLLIDNMIDVTGANLRLVMDKLDEDFEQIISIMEWGTINSNLAGLLEQEKISDANSVQVVSFIKLFSSMMDSSTVSDSFQNVIIGGNTEVVMQMGKMYGDLQDIDICRNSEWFLPLYEADNIEWIGLAKNEFTYRKSDYIIPIVRPVYSYLRHENVGFIVIGIDSELPYEYLKNYSGYEDSRVYMMNDKGEVIADKDKEKIGSVLENYNEILEKIGDRKEGSTVWERQGEKITAVFRQSDITGWYMVQELSKEEIKEQKKVMVNIMLSIVIGIGIMACLLPFVLSYSMNRPIKRILNKIERISEGDFSVDVSMNTEDEFGKIGSGINQMSSNIVSLMEKSVNDEKNKRELELKVLQTQINPHFLYNTLNSIKWMATIQKASGIGEMATALSRLLRNMAKGVADEITIDKELAIIEDYVTIQRFRYGESFRVVYEIPEELKNYKIIKFTLQPLIENAIFHGLEPKSDIGVIMIQMREQEESLQITVEDNGIGMTEERIGQILHGEKEKTKDSLSGMGISNVKERLQLYYGADYGLVINSKVNEYTKIMITLPKRK